MTRRQQETGDAEGRAFSSVMCRAAHYAHRPIDAARIVERTKKSKVRSCWGAGKWLKNLLNVVPGGGTLTAVAVPVYVLHG